MTAKSTPPETDKAPDELEPPAEAPKAKRAEKAPAGPRAGELVTVTYFDTANQVDVTRVALVVDVVDDAVRVAYLNEVSDPIPLDSTCHGDRVDAPRVARVEV